MESIRSHHGLTSHRSARGFSLLELLVVMAIITVITGMMITTQSSFNKTLIVSNTAYDIALTFRYVETYGISSRGVSGVAGVGYGLHFDRNSPGSFISFTDTSAVVDPSKCHGTPPSGDVGAPDAKKGNCVYEQGEWTKDYALGNGIVVSDFCAYSSGSGWSCANSQGSGLTSLDVVFVRPDPNPFIFVNGDDTSGGARTKACLTVTSPEGGSPRYVSIASSGAIMANATQCP